MNQKLPLSCVIWSILFVFSSCSYHADQALNESELLIEEPAVPQTNEILEVSYYGEDIGVGEDLVRSAAQAFTEAYPNVKLSLERIPFSENMNSYYAQLATEVMSGQGPDVFWLDYYNMDIYKMLL